MSWNGLASDQCPPDADVRDGVTNGYIQAPSALPSDLRSDTGVGSAGTYCWTAADFESFINGNGDLKTNTALPTRAEVNGWRLWDPANAPTGLTATWSATLCDVSLTWTDDASVPTVDSGWARDQLEVQVQRCQGSGCSSWSTIGTVDYGIGSFTDTTASATTFYRYRVRYRNKIDGTFVSGWSTIEEITTGTCDGPS